MGGVERYTECLWSRLAARGWQVLIVTCNTDSAPSEEIVAGMQIHRLPSSSLLERRVPLPHPSTDLRRLWRRLCSHPADVVVSNTRFFPISQLAAALSMVTGSPRLHIEHGSSFVTLGRPLVDVATHVYDRFIGSWVIQTADRCCGVSRAAATFASDLGGRDCGVLYNGVDPSQRPDGPGFRSQLGLRSNAVLVAYVGRLIEAKGIRDLLAAHRLIDPPIHLAIAGAGPLAEELQELSGTSEYIHFLGRLTSHEVETLLRDADILCHPSAYPEGLPTVLLEGAAAGAALVATPMGGTEELVTSGVSGLLVPPADPEALSEAIKAVAHDRELRERLTRGARLRVDETFSWDRVAASCETTLVQMMATHPKDRPQRAGRARRAPPPLRFAQEHRRDPRDARRLLRADR